MNIRWNTSLPTHYSFSVEKNLHVSLLIDFIFQSLCFYTAADEVSKVLKSVGIDTEPKWIFSGEKRHMLFCFWLFPFRIAFVLKPTLFEIWISCWVVSSRRERMERKSSNHVPFREPLIFIINHFLLFNQRGQFEVYLI